MLAVAMLAVVVVSDLADRFWDIRLRRFLTERFLRTSQPARSMA